jgi:NAD(P)-dependent dehydrogenase (short-subunit alcohol dehydrogenase family)
MAVCLLTGCGTEIGLTTARLLAHNGHTVFATVRHARRARCLSQFADPNGLPITVLVMDDRADESVQGVVAEVLARAGQIDVLVHHAHFGPGDPASETPMDESDAAMLTSYFGMLRCVRAVLPAMRQRRHGQIITVPTVGPALAGSFLTARCVTEAATDAFHVSLARAVDPFSIRVALLMSPESAGASAGLVADLVGAASVADMPIQRTLVNWPVLQSAA